jgi:hypothetical protein
MNLERRLDRLESSLDTAKRTRTARDLRREVGHTGTEACGRTLDEELAARGFNAEREAELRGLSYPELIRRYHDALRRTFSDA